jgi:hypothetical protein
MALRRVGSQGVVTTRAAFLTSREGFALAIVPANQKFAGRRSRSLNLSLHWNDRAQALDGLFEPSFQGMTLGPFCGRFAR